MSSSGILVLRLGEGKLCLGKGEVCQGCLLMMPSSPQRTNASNIKFFLLSFLPFSLLALLSILEKHKQMED